MLNVGFAATNPCHLYPLAQALGTLGCPLAYYSGYPRWRLPQPHPEPIATHSARTLVTYGLLKLPERLRPRSRTLFRWQDRHFDEWVGRHLDGRHDFVHAMPGQAWATFRSARQRGVRAVLNHATGPSRHWVAVMRPEYERIGLSVQETTVYDEDFWRREEHEYALADWHCAASTLVRDQLIRAGVAADRIWVVPYGAAPDVFYAAPESPPRGPLRLLFAGQVSLRKGLVTLLAALGQVGRPEWSLKVVGAVADEARPDLRTYLGRTPVEFCGAVTQARLAAEMRQASVLVLPSLEEGFGLVVVQALACGLPCVVSDAVGAKDLLQHRANGSIFPARDSGALAQELLFWAEHPRRVSGDYSWRAPAQILYDSSRQALRSTLAQPQAP
ncbi:MAG TPA: glycosyltransferase family 4 protein [Chthoniobacterales bacterium]